MMASVFAAVPHVTAAPIAKVMRKWRISPCRQSATAARARLFSDQVEEWRGVRVILR